MANLVIHEACNLIVDDDGTGGNSKHLSINEITLPVLEEMTQEHNAGGAIGSVTIGGLGVRPTELTFSIRGYDAQALTKFGVYGKESINYTVYGVGRDKSTGVAVEFKCIMKGRMTRVTHDAMRRGDLFGASYTVTELIHLELWIGQEEKYYWDWFSSTYRVDGQSQNDDIRRVLRIA